MWLGPAFLSSPLPLQDGLSLGRSEQPQPICSFQDDFQEFEMIDDEEEDDDEEEEEEEEGDQEGREAGGSSSKAPFSEPLIPSPSLEEPHKHRPTTLQLTTLGAQVKALSGCRPQAHAPGAPLRNSPLSAQDSLNNNGGLDPVPPACWQETAPSSPPQDPLRGEGWRLGGPDRRVGCAEGGLAPGHGYSPFLPHRAARPPPTLRRRALRGAGAPQL